MAFIPEEELQQIRQEADIVDIIGRYLQVQRKGKDFAAICPFHDDHDPSLSISPDKQIYKCFVCGAGGNVFTFVQNYEHVSFPEAVERVARFINHPLSVSVAPTEKKVNPAYEKLYQILNETIQYTMYQLDTPVGVIQKEYLNKRGLDEETRKKFGIGFNPEGDSLFQFLSAKGYESNDMVDCNVVRTSSSGIHDVFAGRIMFPIHDVNGNPIGFSARSIDPNNTSKYMNTTETPVFRKSELVYNAHRAKQEARRDGKIYVTEGVTDVIAFSQAGIENAVCTLGTSCTKEQIQLLKTLAKKVVFCYDGDAAGQAATWRACKMALEAGCEVSIVSNITGLDPDELLRQKGKEALQEFVGNEITWIEFVIRYLKGHYNLDNYSEKKEFAKKAMAEINLLEDDFDRGHFTKEVAELTGFEIESKRNDSVKEIRANRVVQNRLVDGTVAAEELILAMMMHSNEAVLRFEKTLGYLLDPVRNGLAMLIVDAYRKNADQSVGGLIDMATTSEQKDLLAQLATSPEYELPYEQDVLDGAIRKVLISVKTNQADALKEQLRMPMNTESREILLREYQTCLVELRRYIDEENNS